MALASSVSHHRHGVTTSLPDVIKTALSELTFRINLTDSLMRRLEPFNAAKHALTPTDEERVTIIPYSLSPVALYQKMAQLPRTILSNPPDGNSAVEFSAKDMDTSLFAAYPLYVPIFLSEWTATNPGETKPISLTTAMFCYVSGKLEAPILVPATRQTPSDENSWALHPSIDAGCQSQLHLS